MIHAEILYAYIIFPLSLQFNFECRGTQTGERLRLKNTDPTSRQRGRPKSTNIRNCLKIIKDRRRKFG
jgi:hypothetical protein